MLPFLLALLPLAASHGIKAIQFGQPMPIETLISLPTLAPSHERSLNQSREIQHAAHSPHLENDSVDHISLLVDADFAEIDDSLDDSDEFDQWVPMGTTDDTTLVRRANGIEKRAAFRGTMQIDCLEAPEACQNACWYQNCLMNAQGDTTKVKYQDGGRNTKRDSGNRLLSGVTTNRGRACSTWPFGQKFWDTYQFNPNPKEASEKYLETDEWPMASFENPASFDPTADPPQHTLRCITGQSNGGGARAWTNFRRGHGPYAEGGKWEKYRLGAKTHFVRYDEFNVAFNFDSFDRNNADHEKVRKTLTFCEAPYARCRNDGRQFHMSRLVTNGGTSGILAWPYDATQQNAYEVDKEGADIKQYHVILAITGDDEDEVSAQVSVYKNGDQTILATRDSSNTQSLTMNDGDSFSIQGNLPKALKVEKSGIGCGTFAFTYGDPQTDGLAVFSFHSDDRGYGRWSHTEKGGMSGRYCVPEAIRGQDANGNDVAIGTRLKCSFPGW